MFSFFKKNKSQPNESNYIFNCELISCALAYEVAISDGSIDEKELVSLKKEVRKKSEELNIDTDAVFATIEFHSTESISFNDFINQINENFSYDQKVEMIKFLWQTAYADNILDVDEERLIRRIADMINVKDIQVLKLKDQAKND